MKNVFKMMGIALVACSMFASCGDDDATQFTITANANDEAMGTVSGGGVYDSAATCTLTATPNEGYVFVEWNDGVTDNPRTITVTGDATYTATFAEADGVKVTFGTESWRAADILGEEYASYGLLELGCFVNYESSTAPYTQGYFKNSTGTTSHAQGDYYYHFYYENENDYTTDSDGSLTGQAGATLPNWQPSAGFAENVTAIDLTALTITATASGTMFHLPEYINGQQITKDLSINVKNAAWEVAGSKGKTFKTMGKLVK